MITAWLRIHYTLGGRAAFLPMYEKYPDPQALCRAMENRTEEREIMRLISPERFFAYDTVQALATEQLCRENGWRIVPFPSDYYPVLLRQIKNPPAVLFACGDMEILRNPHMAAVVGTRAAARKTADAAVLLGEALAQAGVTVVSGGAYGIDSAAALGAACASGAGCVTVLGRGFDPAQDANRTAPRTVFVTELFPGLSGRAFNFPTRNRLISGLCAGTAVMEAGGKSGALITAGYAQQQGRPVFVPEGSSLSSPGCAALAANGAKEFAAPCELISALFPELTPLPPSALTRLDEAPVGRYEQSLYGAPRRAAEWESLFCDSAPAPVPSAENPTSPAKPPAPTAASPEDLSPEAAAVLKALSDGPRYVDEIIEQLGIPAPKVQVAVTELELEDVIAVGPGGRISLI